MGNSFDVEKEINEIRRLQATKKGKSLVRKVSKIPCTGPSVTEVFAMMNGTPLPVGWERFAPWYRKRKRYRNYYQHLPYPHLIIKNRFVGRNVSLRSECVLRSELRAVKKMIKEESFKPFKIMGVEQLIRKLKK